MPQQALRPAAMLLPMIFTTPELLPGRHWWRALLCSLRPVGGGTGLGPGLRQRARATRSQRAADPGLRARPGQARTDLRRLFGRRVPGPGGDACRRRTGAVTARPSAHAGQHRRYRIGHRRGLRAGQAPRLRHDGHRLDAGARRRRDAVAVRGLGVLRARRQLGRAAAGFDTAGADLGRDRRHQPRDGRPSAAARSRATSCAARVRRASW